MAVNETREKIYISLIFIYHHHQQNNIFEAPWKGFLCRFVRNEAHGIENKNCFPSHIKEFFVPIESELKRKSLWKWTYVKWYCINSFSPFAGSVSKLRNIHFDWAASCKHLKSHDRQRRQQCKALKARIRLRLLSSATSIRIAKPPRLKFHF